MMITGQSGEVSATGATVSKIVYGERIGRGLPLLLGVCAVIFDEAGRVLLTRRRDNDLWCLPGGAFETGESVKEAVVREVEEETGLKVEPLQLIGVYSSPDRMSQYADGNRYQLVVLSFRCRVIGGVEKPATDETTDIGYFACDALPQMVSTQYERIQDAMAGHREALIR